jgi:uncharacterized membrane protein
MKKIQKYWSWALIASLAVLVAFVAITPYLSFNPENFSNVLDGRFGDGSEIWLYIHVISGGLSLLLGSFQFWQWLRDKHRNIHRWLGRIYFFAGIFPASISGVIIAQDTVAGLTGRFGFSVLGILWFVTGVFALLAILQKKIEVHRRWMIRNFALTFAAVTLRLWMLILILGQVHFGVEEAEALAQAYRTVPWLCWVPNLLIAEYLIQSQFQKIKDIKLVVTED